MYTCVWDEFLEFLLENRVPTSADFNTYPIRIFHIYSHFILWTEIVSVAENVQIARKYITFSVTIKEGCVKF